MNGQREDANSFMVNGSNVEETNNNGTSIVPTPGLHPGIPAFDQLV